MDVNPQPNDRIIGGSKMKVHRVFVDARLRGYGTAPKQTILPIILLIAASIIFVIAASPLFSYSGLSSSLRTIGSVVPLWIIVILFIVTLGWIWLGESRPNVVGFVGENRIFDNTISIVKGSIMEIFWVILLFIVLIAFFMLRG
jgi:hypothetical protein